MALVKNKDSKIEKRFSALLKERKIRAYKQHVPNLPGKPDFAFRKKKVAVFIDSCFWHGCRYHGSLPKTNRRFWSEKIARNKARDAEVNGQYRKMGWSVYRVWEHRLKRPDSTAGIDHIFKALSG